MDCREKFPGQILLTPLFPDGRGELIDILLPGLECEVKSYFLPEDLDLRGIKRNKNPVECLKPQKSKLSNNTTTPKDSPDPRYPFPNGATEWPGGFPPDPSPPFPPPRAGETYANSDLRWYLLRIEVGGSFTQYRWLWLFYGGTPPLKKVSTSGSDFVDAVHIRHADFIYFVVDSMDFHVRNWVYAQGFAIPRNDTYLRGRDLSGSIFGGGVSRDSIPLGISIEEIEATMTRGLTFGFSETGTNFVELTFDRIQRVLFALEQCQTIGRTCIRGFYTLGYPEELITNYRFFFNGVEVERSEDTITLNEGDNGMKEDCCDCIEAMAALMEAYMEKVEKLIKESEARIKEHINDTAYRQCVFFQEQLKAFDITDDDRVIERIDRLENNIWTGGELTPLNINSENK